MADKKNKRKYTWAKLYLANVVIKDVLFWSLNGLIGATFNTI